MSKPKRVFDVLLEIDGDKLCGNAFATDAMDAVAVVKELHESKNSTPWSAVTIVAVLPQSAATTLTGPVRASIWSPKECH